MGKQHETPDGQSCCAARDCTCRGNAGNIDLTIKSPNGKKHRIHARNRCRRAGLQLGTMDAVIARLCIHHELMLLTTDNDFVLAARHCDLQVWGAAR